MAKISIDGEYIELIKLLKAAGLCDTGGAAKNAVDDGVVTVDGAVESRKRCKIRKGQVVEIDGNVIEVE
jgi:ribosome-associated protein